MKILKFGGSSIADAGKIQHVAGIIEDTKKNSELAIVVSAFGGVTDAIKTLAESAAAGKDIDSTFDSLVTRHTEYAEALSIINEENIRYKLDEYFTQLKSDLLFVAKEKHLSSQSLDKVLSYGELISTTVVAEYLSQIGIAAEQLDTRKVILTDDQYGYAFVFYQRSYDRIRRYLQDRTKTQVITGFLGSTETGTTTTLGRSGSDYTAAIFGAALHAEAIEIWTDVNGIFSADPSIIQEAEAVPHLTYEEAMELAHAGARVIFPPIIIKNTFNPDHPGSKISKDRAATGKTAVGISSLSNVSLIRLQGAGMVGMKGMIGRIFSTLSRENINIILVSQAFSEHSVCFAINTERNAAGVKALETEFAFELQHHYIDKIKMEENLSLVAVVGEGMRHTPGVSGRIFSTLGNKCINVVAIAQGSSERNISFIVDDKDVDAALKTLHKEFFVMEDGLTDIYLVGVGTIGSELLDLISQEGSTSLQIRAVGTREKMLLGDSAINPAAAKEELKNSTDPFVLYDFIRYGNIGSNQRIFVDCTASQAIAKKYLDIIDNGFSVVTANKIANTLDQEYYRSIRESAQNHNVHFRYETNVGAGLPIINTLQGLLATGDEVFEIHGILSGTLSYLFNSFDGQTTFSSLVSSAREKGLTEPDPREDLNGMDVARKILILARETGAKLVLPEVSVESLIPGALDPDLPVDEFLRQFADFDSFFLDRLEKAGAEQKVLRYVGSWDGNKAKVGLEAVDHKSPFFHLHGSENLILFKTRRYHDVPLVIKGYGAGAAVTAAGVFQDIQACIKG